VKPASPPPTDSSARPPVGRPARLLAGSTAGSKVERLLLLRSHSLGDVILTTGIVAALARGESRWTTGLPAIEVVTAERYQAVFRGNPQVAGLVSTEELIQGGTGRISRSYTRVIDLQATIGSGRLARAFGPVSRLRTRGAARRWVVLWGERFPRPAIPHCLQRYAEAAGLDPELGPAAYRPQVMVTPEEEAEARRLAPRAFSAESGLAVAVISGASRRTKEYPEDLLGRVAGDLARRGQVVWRLAAPAVPGERDRPDLPHLGDLPLFRLPLGPLKAVLARTAAVVVSDSGPMHLASALGIPVVAIFGSGVRAFGFTPTGVKDRILEVTDLACRPCGVHGRNRCWLRNWRCLRDLAPERVVEEVEQLLSENGQGRPGAGRRTEGSLRGSDHA
jgi:ADP-heptose:LPS heptosyltransferase